ncbi:hypothetical protein NEF87_002399 [Candidatus Lokiarchaeum ossiferum]|uniref:PAC domain-containing protein n=1 Tax=Candidatus Lokiarchaeum ossiferum TaxID=2951803 RepID=A0ABY6HU93_9ARCH|nr:hypothetical protein NEF87_002399 [Candidatus Lokiarchaeum sp. B-35]
MVTLIYFEYLQLILIIPKAIESSLFFLNIILAYKKYSEHNWNDRPLVERLFFIGLIGWFIYIFLDIFIFLFAPVSMSLAPDGIYKGYLSNYLSLTLVNLIRDIAFTGALIQLWSYFFASLTILLGEAQASKIFRNWVVRMTVLVISLIVLAFDQIKVEILDGLPIVNAEYQGLGGFVIGLFICIYFGGVVLLISSLRKEILAQSSNKMKHHILALILGVLIMGIGNLYWLFLGILEGAVPLLFHGTSNRFFFTYLGHFIWTLSPIFIYFGFQKPIDVSPKIDDDYNKIGMFNFKKLVEEEFLAMYLIKGNRIIYINALMKKCMKMTLKNQNLWDIETLFSHIHPQDLPQVKKYYDFQNLDKIPHNFYELRYLCSDNEVKWVKQITIPIIQYKEPVLQIIFEDITERKLAEQEKKTLQGLLPICASCKKIRDDEGYYVQIERYLHDHSDVEFTHGLCPDCMEKMFKEIDSKDNEKKN